MLQELGPSAHHSRLGGMKHTISPQHVAPFPRLHQLAPYTLLPLWQATRASPELLC